jgi:hypothetical protein
MFVSCSLQADTVTLFQIYVSIGPRGNTSPSYAAYTANAQAGVAGGGVNKSGDIATDPTAFNVVTTGTAADLQGSSITNTPFPSWMGTADPSGALAAEKGSMAYWSIDFQGTNISLSNITVTQMSTDKLDYFGDGAGGLFTFSFSGQDYGADFVGIASDGTVITSGSGTQQVKEIIITGFAVAQDGYGFGFTGTDAQQLTQINNAFTTGLGTPYDINTCYYYGTADSINPNSCDTTSVKNVLVGTVVPEPSSFNSVALAFALMPLAWMFRRLRRA